MEQKENLYIRLFKPLKNKEKDDIYRIWMKNIEEDIYYKREAIKEYCDSMNHNYLMAIYCIYSMINNKCLVKTYIIDESSFLENEYVAYWFYLTRNGLKKQLTDQIKYNTNLPTYEQLALVDEVIESIDKYGYAIYNTEHFNKIMQGKDFGPDVISMRKVLNDIDAIKFEIKNIFDKRDPQIFIDDSFINDPSNTPSSVNMEELSEIDRLFYIPYNQPKNQILIKEEISDDLTDDNKLLEKELKNIKQPEPIVFSEPAIKEDEKEKIKQSEELDENIEKEAKENNNSDKYDYKDIANKLNEFIENQLPETYKTVIVEGKLPNDLRPLRFRKKNKSNIYRFMDCFNISPLSKSKIIFDLEVLPNHKPNSYSDDFSKILKQINPEYRKKTEEYKKNKNNK